MYKCLLFNMDNSPMLRRALGSHRIAHYLRENEWDAEVIDFASHWSFENLTQLALQRFDSNTKWIGISFLFNDQEFDTMLAFLIWVKKHYPHIKIIFGSPTKFKRNIDIVDYNINGFGELALLELLKYLFSNGPAPRFSMFTNSGKNISANSSYPAYPMSSLNVIYEDRDFIEYHEWLGIEFARGCIFQCAFCNFPVLGVKGDYTRDADDFRIQMQDAYDRFGVTNYYISDETFNDRTEKITKFADVVETLNFKPWFSAFLRGDLMVSRPQDRVELLRMGVLGQFYGVETFHHEAGKSIGKGMDPERLKTGLLDIKRYYETHDSKKFRGTISLISGLPHETVESLYETKDWLRDNWQGEFYTMYPVEISMSEQDYPSKFSKDWEKYGYRDASKDEDMKEFTLHRNNIIDRENLLIWKNDQMSFKECTEITGDIEQMKEDPQYDFRLANFALVGLQLPPSLDERLALKLDYDGYKSIPWHLINKYIDKKLNL